MKGKILILTCLILLIVSMASVSAADDANQTISDDALSVSHDIDVISEKDDGTFTALQEKISDAPEGAIINLENNYTYDSGFSTDGITINKNLTIVGNGYVIDALGQSRIFHITSSSVTLNDITFKNGYAEDYGGAIYFENETSGSMVSGVFIDNSAGYGGAIYFYGDSNMDSDSGFVKFYDDFVLVGGKTYFYDDFIFIDDGVYLHEDFIIIYDEVFFYNVSGEDSDSHSVEFYEYYVLVDDEAYSYDEFILIDGETYVYWDFMIIGVEIFFYSRTPIVSGEFIGNSADYGGAIYCEHGFDSPVSGKFIDNAAKDGGAVWTISGSFENCNFTDNYASGNGGAVCFSDSWGPTRSFENCNFADNKASGSGGAIYFSRGSGAGSVENCNFTHNIASSCGGAICVEDEARNIVSCEFKGNAAKSGGAIYFHLVSDDTISGDFIGNSADYGGAICCGHRVSDSSIYGQFVNNSADYGGAIYFYGIYYADYFFRSSLSGEFIGNDADYGGAIYFETKVSDSRISGEFINNTASGNGGAINFEYDVYDSNVSGEFIGNSAKDGGAIYFWNGVYNSNVSGEFIGNSAKVGSAIFFNTIYYSEENFNFIINSVVLGSIYNTDEIVFVNDWFGRNASNYKIGPCSTCDSWLFLNASSAPITGDGGKSTVVFTLDNLYNASSNTISHPDISDLPDVVFELSALNGYLDKYSARPGESIIFTPTGNKRGIVKATFGGVSYSIELVNLKLDVPDVTKNYGGSEKLEITLTEEGSPIANADVNININNEDYVRTTDSNGKASMPIELNADSYDAIVSYGDISTTAKIIVNKASTTNTLSYAKNTHNNVILTALVNPATATGDVVFTVNNNDYAAKISDGKAVYNLSNLAVGNYDAKATYGGDTNHEASNSSSISFNVEEHYVNIAAPDVTKTYGGSEKLEITLTNQDSKALGNAELKIKIADKSLTKNTDVNGKVYVDLNMDSGNYTADIIFEGNDEYAKVTATSKITINEINTETTLSSTKNSPNTVTLTALVDPATVAGDVVFTVNGKDYTAKITEGKATYLLSNLDVGSYNVKATYDGDVNHKSSVSNAISFTVEDVKYDVSAPDLTKYYKGPEKFVVTVKEDNKPVFNKSVSINLNGATYTRTTNENGQASMAINLNSGTYKVTSEFEGIEVESTITVKSTVSGENITKIFRNGTQYYATFVDTSGKLMRNTDVNFNINGVFYTRTTNDQGVARMNINLNPEEYVITARNPNSTEQYTNVITVLPSIVEVHDLTKYYKNASKLTFRLLDDQGRPVGAGVSANININGVFYTRQSNESGYVNMNINLNPGTYIATLEYNGLMASSTVKVLSVIETKNLDMKYRDGSLFEAMILDGQGDFHPDQKVTFNINGVFYNKVTDENGLARLAINLMAGEYIITTSYNGLNAANKITISS